MKAAAILLSLLLTTSILTSCSKIDNSLENSSGSQTSQTLQAENPVPDTEIQTTSETTTTASETTFEQTTTTVKATETVTVTTTLAETTKPPVTTKAAVTTTKPVTTAEITTTKPVTTAKVTTTAPPETTANISANTYKALNFQEQKGMWISYLEFQNILKGKSKEQFTASVKKMYDNCNLMGINTVYVHARSHSDAFYKSDLFPWSKNCTGTIGVDPGFDPFKILVDEAHNRGLSVHAWINPLRGMNDSDIKNIADKYLMKQWYNDSSKNGKYIVNVDGVWYLSPAYKETRDLIVNGVKEIISKYNVDGIHIDDYFYPTTENYFDQSAFSQSGSSNRSQWRLDIVSGMVKELYSGIKATNPSVVFGVSPQGNISNNYSFQYADVRKWTSQNGYLDYIVPQIYFGFNNKTQPYETNLKSWCDMVTNSNVKLVVGLAPYKIGTVESTGEWKNDKRILARQIEAFRKTNKYGGAAFFRYESLFSPSSGVAVQINAELSELKAILN